MITAAARVPLNRKGEWRAAGRRRYYKNFDSSPLEVATALPTWLARGNTEPITSFDPSTWGAPLSTANGANGGFRISAGASAGSRATLIGPPMNLAEFDEVAFGIDCFSLSGNVSWQMGFTDGVTPAATNGTRTTGLYVESTTDDILLRMAPYPTSRTVMTLSIAATTFTGSGTTWTVSAGGAPVTLSNLIQAPALQAALNTLYGRTDIHVDGVFGLYGPNFRVDFPSAMGAVALPTVTNATATMETVGGAAQQSDVACNYHYGVTGFTRGTQMTHSIQLRMRPRITPFNRARRFWLAETDPRKAGAGYFVPDLITGVVRPWVQIVGASGYMTMLGVWCEMWTSRATVSS